VSRPGGGPARIRSGSPFEERIGFSRAVVTGDRVLVSGTAPVWPDGSCPADPGEQARRCLEIIAAALAEAGGGLADVVRTRIFLTAAGDAGPVGTVHAAVLGDVRPAATMVVVAGLLDPRWKVEVEAEAVVRQPAPASTARLARQDRAPSGEPADSADAALANEPIEPIEQADPTDPMERTEPRQPMHG
jgi:enamine deaminase RidA (YjgF/YER057c/UK114 family)